MGDRKKMTADEFLVWIETQSERYELVDGVPVRMVDREVDDLAVLQAFSRGEISRRQAMRKLDISYSELLDRIAQKGLGLPRVSREEAKRMGHVMDKILDRAGVAMTTDWRALHGSLKGKGNGKRLSIEEINGAAAMTDDETLTHEEAAALVGGYATLAHRVAVGDLPRFPDGKFRRGDVEALRDRLAKHPAHPWGLEAALRQVRATGSMGFSPREAVLEDLIADGDAIKAELAARVPGLLVADAEGIAEVLCEMPVRSPWMRLEWLLTPDDTLGGLSPLEALQEGRMAEVIEIARSHGAD